VTQPPDGTIAHAVSFRQVTIVNVSGWCRATLELIAINHSEGEAHILRRDHGPARTAANAREGAAGYGTNYAQSDHRRRHC
jgi:hypothetical protein